MRVLISFFSLSVSLSLSLSLSVKFLHFVSALVAIRTSFLKTLAWCVGNNNNNNNNNEPTGQLSERIVVFRKSGRVLEFDVKRLRKCQQDAGNYKDNEEFIDAVLSLGVITLTTELGSTVRTIEIMWKLFRNLRGQSTPRKPSTALFNGTKFFFLVEIISLRAPFRILHISIRWASVISVSILEKFYHLFYRLPIFIY